MSETEFFDAGFEELEAILSEFAKSAENVVNVLEMGASELVKDVRKLPSPRSRMNGSGYTHLLDTMSYKRVNNEIEVGWGKYYGPMVEKGTIKMRARAHLSPTYQINKERYYKKMIEKIGG